MSRRVLAAVVSAPLLVAGAVAVAPSAGAATAPVRISYVYFDSPGSDTGKNSSLNAEYVKIQNTTKTARSLSGWTLRDKSNHVYTFPAFTLRAGAAVTVRSGKGTDTTSTRYYQKSWYVWNNTGDTAYLRNRAGALVSSCTWGSKGPAKTC